MKILWSQSESGHGHNIDHIHRAGGLSGGTKRATSVNMSLLRMQSSEGEIHNILRNRARAQVLLQARKLHVWGSGAYGAFWVNAV